MIFVKQKCCWLTIALFLFQLHLNLLYYKYEPTSWELRVYHIHCVKSVRTRSYSGPYLPVFGLNTERYSDECEKIQTRITPNTDTFYAVIVSQQATSSQPTSLRVANPRVYDLRVCKLTICVPEHANFFYEFSILRGLLYERNWFTYRLYQKSYHSFT